MNRPAISATCTTVRAAVCGHSIVAMPTANQRSITSHLRSGIDLSDRD
ncbi:MAG: hypothetical protein ABIP03_12575 [Aquihabitans sp.]